MQAKVKCVLSSIINCKYQHITFKLNSWQEFYVVAIQLCNCQICLHLVAVFAGDNNANERFNQINIELHLIDEFWIIDQKTTISINIYLAKIFCQTMYGDF